MLRAFIFALLLVPLAAAEKRIAVFVALGELRALETFADTLDLARKTAPDEHRVQVAALRALSWIGLASAAR